MCQGPADSGPLTPTFHDYPMHVCVRCGLPFVEGCHIHSGSSDTPVLQVYSTYISEHTPVWLSPSPWYLFHHSSFLQTCHRKTASLLTRRTPPTGQPKELTHPPQSLTARKVPNCPSQNLLWTRMLLDCTSSPSIGFAPQTTFSRAALTSKTHLHPKCPTQRT